VTIRRRVLLLNPPGRRRYLRDNYCSHVSKGRYLWPPQDLLAQSGQLVAHHDVEVLDCVAQGVGPEECRQRVLRGGYDALVFVTGLACWQEDMPFLASLVQQGGFWTAASGDVLLHRGEQVRQKFGLPHAILDDYATPELAAWLGHPVDGVRLGSLRAGGPWLSMPRPRHELFPLARYHLPHLRAHPFASLLVGFGCPYRCRFCPFERLPYRLRPVDQILEELRALAALGIRELWIKDQTFAVRRQHTLELLGRMQAEGLRFGWSCETRADLLDARLLGEMVRSGCHTVMLGVESASQQVLDRYHKDLRLDQVEQAFRLCRDLGVRTLAHFCLGLPGETPDSLGRILDQALRLDPDYASFNVATPMPGTSFHEEALEQGWIEDDADGLDNSDSFPAWSGPDLTPEQVWRAHSRAVRGFYLRPGWMLRRILGLRSWYEARNLMCEGLQTLARILVRAGQRP